MMEIWKVISERFFFNKFRQNLLVLTSGNVAVQALSILSYPILTRLYPAEIFGQYALFNGIMLLLSFAVTLRYEVAIPLPQENHKAQLLKKSTLFISTVFIGVVGIISIIVHWLDLYPPLSGVIILIPPVALASSMLQTYRFWYLRTNKMLNHFKVFLSYRGLYIIIAIALPLLAINTMNGLITAIFASSMFILFFLIFSNKNDFKIDIDLKTTLPLLKEYYRFPKFSLPSMVLGHITNQVPIFILTYYFGKGITGQYSVAYTLLFLPQTILIGRISEALYQNYSHQSIKKLPAIVHKIWRRVVLMMIGPCIVLFLFGSNIFEILLGSAWKLAGSISEYLAIAIFFGSLLSSTSSIMQILNLQKIGFYLSLFRLSYIVIAFVVGGIFNDLFMGIKIMVFMISVTDIAITIFLNKKLQSSD